MSEYLFGRRRRPALEQLSRSELLIFDFDGTLAPIVLDPARAAPRASTKKLLSRLARRRPCAVLSGRSRADVANKLRGVRLWAIVGNHGLEGPWPNPASRRTVLTWRRQLGARLADVQGVVIEDKGFTLSVHYRRAKARTLAKKRVWSAARELRAARLVDGKMVLNVLPRGAMDKGSAVLRLKRESGASSVLFVGDDVTDEHVFELGRAWLRGVRIGRAAGSAADFHLRSQQQIDRLLEVLQEPTD